MDLELERFKVQSTVYICRRPVVPPRGNLAHRVVVIRCCGEYVHCLWWPNIQNGSWSFQVCFHHFGGSRLVRRSGWCGSWKVSDQCEVCAGIWRFFVICWRASMATGVWSWDRDWSLYEGSILKWSTLTIWICGLKSALTVSGCCWGSTDRRSYFWMPSGPQFRFLQCQRGWGSR